MVWHLVGMMRSGIGFRMSALSAAVAAAVLLAALPGSIAVAAKADVECKVHNLNQASDRASLQRAVAAADPGDALLVQGTCTGTTLIDKDLDISYMGWAGAPMPLGSEYVTDPKGRIASGSSRPALVVDADVESFVVNPGLVVAGGIVIGDVAAWADGAGAARAAWRNAAPSTLASIPATTLAECHLRNDETGDEYRVGQSAMNAAAAGDRLSIRGSCGGETVIDQPTTISGWRIAISSMSLGGSQGSSDDSGPATLARVSVGSDVDRLVLKDVRVTRGFDIAGLAP